MKFYKGLKRALGAVFLAGIFLGAPFICNAPAVQDVAYADIIDGLEYEASNNGDYRLVKCYDTKSTEIEVPAEVSGRNVVTIESDAFADCKSLTKLKLPASIQNIADGALTCPKLAEIEVYGVQTSTSYFATGDGVLMKNIGTGSSTRLVQYPPGKIDPETGKAQTSYKIDDNVTEIAASAFRGATSLQSIDFGSARITEIRANAFSGCTSLIELHLPSSIRTIEQRAFFGCTKLQHIDLGELVNPTITTPDPAEPVASGAPLPTPIITYELSSSLTTVGVSAFEECTSLASIRIPASCSSIGRRGFYGCRGLSKIEFDQFEGSSAELRIGEEAFAMCTNNNLSEIVLPRSLSNISNKAFYGSGGKDFMVILSENVSAIGEEAFAESKIVRIEVPSRVTTLKRAAFKNCRNLAQAELYSVGGNNYGITVIEEEAFYGCTSLAGLTMPARIQTIGPRAFYGTKIRRLTLPSSITSIGEESFSSCKSLTDIIIPADVAQIGKRTFSDCTALTSVNITGNVSDIGEEAFYGCSKLTEFKFSDEDAGTSKPESQKNYNQVKTMGVRAFAGCSAIKSIRFSTQMQEIPAELFKACKGLVSVEIPASIRKIGDEAFYGCTGMTSLKFNNINLDADDRYDLVLGNRCFYGCTKLETVAFSNNIRDIPAYSFYQSGIKELKIPYTTKTIGDSAFEASGKLEKLELGVDPVEPENPLSGVTSIGKKAFYSCTKLAEVSFSKDMTSIPEYAFASTGIKKLVIPANIKSLDRYAFNKCSALTSVICENDADKGLETIGEYCFAGDSAITEVDLGMTVNSVGVYAFSGLTKLEKFTFSPELKVINANVFNKSFNGSSDTVLTIPGTVETIKSNAFASSTVPNVVIEDGVKTIETLAFTGCKSMKTLRLPTTITEIPSSTFINCSALTSLVIPGNVTRIGADAFNKCSALTSVVMEEGVARVGERVFLGCKLLTDVTFPSTLTELPDHAFESCTSMNSITIPGTIKMLGDMVFYKCSGLESVTLESGVEILGEGVFQECKKLTDITFSDTMDNIPKNTFNLCTGLTSIVIPSNIKTIGDSAFKGDAKIRRVTLEEGVEEIGKSTFEGCSAIISVSLPETLKKIDNNAFSRNSLLTSIEIPGAVEKISDEAFENCAALRKVTLNEGTKTIGASAFASCKVLEEINFPSTVESIGAKAFSSCAALKTPGFSESLTTIGESAFSGCVLFDKITIPKNVNSIGKSAFTKCSNLISVTFTGNAPEICDKTVFAGTPTRIYHYVGTTGYTDPEPAGWWNGIWCEEIDIRTIQAESYPTRTTYIQGQFDTLDTEGMKIVAVYTNGDTVDITPYVVISNFNGDPDNLGIQNVEISYPNSRDKLTFTIEVIEKTLESIEIQKEPDKVKYVRGKELDRKGMVVAALFDNGKTEDVSALCEFRGYSKDLLGKQSVTVSYTFTKSDGTPITRTAKFDVEVIDRTLYNIRVGKAKTKYSQGADFDYNNTEIIGIYDQGEEMPLGRDEFEIVGFDTSTTGTKQVMIVARNDNGDEFTDYIVIDVVEKVPLEMIVSNKRTEFVRGEVFGDDCATVEIRYDNGKTEKLEYGDYQANLNLTQPPYDCTITYGAFTETYYVTLVEKAIIDINITEPTKLVYAVGEALDITGLTVTAVYNDGSTAPISSLYYTVDGFTSASPGRCTVSVMYQGKIKNFFVTINDISLIDFDISSYTKTYIVGETFNRNSMIVYAVYSDNTRSRIDGYNISGFDSSTPGDKMVTVSYSGITKQIPVTIIAPTVTISNINVERLKNNSYVVGETYFDRSSIKVTVVYSNGTSEVLNDDDYNITGFNTSSAGTFAAELSYLGQTRSIAYTVVDKTLTDLQFTPPNQDALMYTVGDRTINTSGMRVTAVYSDGSSADVTSNCEISGFDTSTPGSKTIRVTYINQTKTYNITVIAAAGELTGITVANYTRTYMQGTAFDSSNLKLYANYSDFSIKELNSGEYTVSGFDSSREGVCRVTVSYEGKTASFDVIIIASQQVQDIIGINVAAVGSNEYIVGATTFDRASITVTAIKSDGTEDIIEDYSITGFNTSSAGSKTLTVSYLNYTQTFEIRVINKSVTAITVVPPTKKNYIQGESFDAAGMNVTAIYSDGTQSNVTGQAMVSGFDSSLPGIKTISVAYGGKTQTFTVEVKAPVSSSCRLTLQNARISRSGRVTTEITAENTTNNVITGSLVVAVYEKNADGTQGAMAAIYVSSETIGMGEMNFAPSLDAADSDADEFIVTAYLWQDMMSMIPIAEKSSLEI